MSVFARMWVTISKFIYEGTVKLKRTKMALYSTINFKLFVYYLVLLSSWIDTMYC